MNAFVMATLPTVLLGLLFKSAGLLLLAGAACLLLRRASAATRHLVWSFALGGLLLLPLLSLSLPHWNLAVRRAPTPVSPRPLPPALAPQETSPPAPLLQRGEPENGQNCPTVMPPQRDSPSRPHSASPSASPSLKERGPGGEVLLTVWLLGVVVLLARLAVGLRRVELIRRRSVPLDAATLVLAESLRDGFGLRRPVTFLRAAPGSGVAVPLTWGGRRPTVLLPEQSGAWPADTCRAALLHELAHVARWDWTTQTLARLACALYWVNPLVWVAARLSRAESERACDDCVLQAGLSAADYAQNLVDVVRSMPPGPPLRTAAIAMAQPSEVESRLRALLAKGRNRRPLTRKLALGTLAVFLLISLPLAALRLTAQAQITLTAADATQPTPDGGTVRLVGISEYPSGPGTWWSKDGVRLPRPPAESLDHNVILSKAPAGQMQREILLETVGTNSGDDFTVKSSPEPSTSSGISINPEHTRTRVGFMGGFPVAQQTCTIRVGVASQPWRTLTTTERLGGSSNGSTDGLGSYSVSFSTPSEIKGHVAYTIADTVMALPTRVVAIDTHGRTVESGVAGGNSSAGVIHQRTVTFPGLALKDIKELQLQWRPYDWIEFKNVPLQPVMTTDTQNRQSEEEKQGEGTSPLQTVAPTAVGPGSPRPALFPGAASSHPLSSVPAAPQKETAMKNPLIAPAIALFGFSAAAAPAQVPAATPISVSASASQNANAQSASTALARQIAELELKLALNAPFYGPQHPLLVSTRTELADAYAELATLRPPDGAVLIANAAGAVMEPKIAELTQQEKTAEKRYGLNHPSVARPKAQIASIRQWLTTLRQAAATQSAGQTSAVPALRPAAQKTTAASPLTAAQAKTVIQQTCSRMDAAINRKDLAAAMAFFAPEFVGHDLGDGTLVTQTVMAANLHDQFSQPGQIGERTRVLQATAAGNKITVLVQMTQANSRDEAVARETWRRSGQGWVMTGMDGPKTDTAPTPKPAAVPAPANLRPASAAPAARPLTAAQAKAAIQQACSHMDAVLDSKDITAVLALLMPNFTRQSPEGAWEDPVAFAADLQRLFARPGPLNAQTRVLKVTIENNRVTAIVTQSFARRADSDTPQAFTLSETWRRVGGNWFLSHMGEYNEITPAPTPPAAAKTSRTAPAARTQVSPTTMQNQYVQVTGVVKAPGIYAYRPGMRLRDLIALGGGPTQPLDTIQATVIIDGKTRPIDLVKLMKGDPSQNFALTSDGILILAPKTAVHQ